MPERRTGYAYTNTRVRVMKSKLLAKQDFEKMMKMSLPEIAKFLRESDYSREIDELGLKYSGANLVEYAINKNMANSFRRVHDFALKDSKQAITSYLKKWDVWNIKTILRGKRFGASHDEISITLVPAGLLKENFLKKVIETSKNYDDAIRMFQNTEYASILMKHKGKPEELEDALDRTYYSTLVSAIPREIKPFARSQIDVLNALGKARAKDTEMRFAEIQGGSKEGAKAKAGTPEELTTQLTKSLIISGSRMLHDFRMNLKPVVGYFASKENEIRNIRLIARGKHSGLPQETIEKNLVI